MALLSGVKWREIYLYPWYSCWKYRRERKYFRSQAPVFTRRPNGCCTVAIIGSHPPSGVLVFCSIRSYVGTFPSTTMSRSSRPEYPSPGQWSSCQSVNINRNVSDLCQAAAVTWSEDVSAWGRRTESLWTRSWGIIGSSLEREWRLSAIISWGLRIIKCDQMLTDQNISSIIHNFSAVPQTQILSS